MLNDPGILISAFMLGFLGSAHCLGMCGGLASALGLHTSSSNKASFLLSYNLGRVISYCIAGLIVGSLGFWLSKQLAALEVLRYLAATMLILMGLYLGQWFNGILWAEKLGSKLWPLIQPLSKRFMPIKSIKDALVVGMVWGWLPCGLVYSALIWASLEASIFGSALIMLAFGLGTLPSMLSSGLLAQKLSATIRKRWFRSSAGAMMTLFGLWSLPVIQKTVYQLLNA
ncbi:MULTISPECIES: sulfite exporter TauE/SafE family protein [unclassified Oleiphilus]|uniref:sulfite exporter TauE/SafE family protein n=4 Tax=Oleiphilus TaxID=141450 RepID=UPI000A7723F1|nr:MULTISPECIES: sulfite exporter TauE/SafE family protein [unclassified Oleiphilus]